MRRLLFFVTLTMLHACRQPNHPPQTDFCEQLHRNDTVDLYKELGQLDSLMRTKTGVYVLEDGGGSLITRAWLCEHAQKSIDIQYFIFSTDNVGLIACDYLVRAADRGIDVRIIVDDVMVDADVEDILVLDSHERISIKIYNPGMNLGKNILGKIKKLATDFRSANQRMHNKTFTVDGLFTITGGRNIADEYFDYDHEYNFRDRDVLLMGQAVQTVNASFETYWNSPLCMAVTDLLGKTAPNATDSHRFDKLHQYACNPDNFWPQIRTKIDLFHQTLKQVTQSDKLVWPDNVEFVYDMPGKNDGSQGLGGGGITTSALAELVANARHSIDIQSPYLIMDYNTQQLFANAVKRGVKVRILTNSLASTDNVEAFSGYQSNRRKLLEAGIRIYEFRPDAAERYRIMTGDLQKKLEYAPIFGLHSKTMVVDGHTTVIGTFNLDPRSANLNTECVTVMRSPKLAQQVLAHINEEFKPENAWETTLEWNPDAYVSRYKRAKTWTRKVIPKGIL